MSATSSTTPPPPPGWGAAPPRPSWAMAGWALGLTLVGCCGVGLIVGVVLGFVVLNRCRETGQDHGRGLAIAALFIGWIHAFLALLLVPVLVFSFSSLLEGSSVALPAVRSDAPLLAQDLHVGDCFTDSSTDPHRVGTLNVVPCSRPHYGEVTAVFRLHGKRYPGRQRLRASSKRCGAPTDRYLGGSAAHGLALRYYYPLPAQWRAPAARRLVCFLSSPHHATSRGSARGAGTSTDSA